MKRSLSLLAAVAIFYAGCNSNPMAPPPSGENTNLAGIAIVSEGGKVKLDGDNTKITFVGTKPDGKHDGGFKTLSGEIRIKQLVPFQSLPPAERGSVDAVNVEIEAESLYADDPKLTNHLKDNDFFQVKQHPKITFTSTKVVSPEGKTDEMVITGDLTIRGTKKSVSIPVKVDLQKGFYLTGSFKINRKDFGMNYGEGKIHDEVSVNVVVGQPAAAKKG